MSELIVKRQSDWRQRSKARQIAIEQLTDPNSRMNARARSRAVLTMAVEGLGAGGEISAKDWERAATSDLDPEVKARLGNGWIDAASWMAMMGPKAAAEKLWERGWRPKGRRAIEALKAGAMGSMTLKALAATRAEAIWRDLAREAGEDLLWESFAEAIDWKREESIRLDRSWASQALRGAVGLAQRRALRGQLGERKCARLMIQALCMGAERFGEEHQEQMIQSIRKALGESWRMDPIWMATALTGKLPGKSEWETGVEPTDARAARVRLEALWKAGAVGALSLESATRGRSASASEEPAHPGWATWIRPQHQEWGAVWDPKELDAMLELASRYERSMPTGLSMSVSWERMAEIQKSAMTVGVGDDALRVALERGWLRKDPREEQAAALRVWDEAARVAQCENRGEGFQLLAREWAQKGWLEAGLDESGASPLERIEKQGWDRAMAIAQSAQLERHSRMPTSEQRTPKPAKRV